MTEEIILKPQQTEKAAAGQSAGRPVYTFRVPPRIGKTAVKEAVSKLYKVKPFKVRIVNVPAKRRVYRGRPARKPGYKKALVYLVPGEKIDLQ